MFKWDVYGKKDERWKNGYHLKDGTRKDSYDLEVCNGMFMVRRMKDRRMVMI